MWSHADYQATSTSHGDLILRIPLHPFAWEIPGDGTKAGIWNVVILVEGKQNLNRTTEKKLTNSTSGTSFRGYLHVRCSFSYVILIKSIMCKWKAEGQNSKMKKYEKCQSFGQSWARFNTAGHRRHWMVTGLGLQNNQWILLRCSDLFSTWIAKTNLVTFPQVKWPCLQGLSLEHPHGSRMGRRHSKPIAFCCRLALAEAKGWWLVLLGMVVHVMNHVKLWPLLSLYALLKPLPPSWWDRWINVYTWQGPWTRQKRQGWKNHIA